MDNYKTNKPNNARTPGKKAQPLLYNPPLIHFSVSKKPPNSRMPLQNCPPDGHDDDDDDDDNARPPPRHPLVRPPLPPPSFQAGPIKMILLRKEMEPNERPPNENGRQMNVFGKLNPLILSHRRAPSGSISLLSRLISSDRPAPWRLSRLRSDFHAWRNVSLNFDAPDEKLR